MKHLKLMTLLSQIIWLSHLYSEQQGIAVYQNNAHYWQYDGEPVVLIGGSSDDNLFQVTGVESELELLHSIGGNYVRCTLSARDKGNEKPYLKNAEGLYDLNEFNPAYWERLESFLAKAEELQIVVQIEIWATYDFYWHTWDHNPFNPTLNTNYDESDGQLPGHIEHPAQLRLNPFFQTIPELENIPLVLNYQKAFVDQVCKIAFEHNNVLFCIDNETTSDHRWGRYWSKYMRDAAETVGRSIYVTEMWDAWDPTDGEVSGAIMQDMSLGGWFDTNFNPELHEHSGVRYSLSDAKSYQFVDVANNNSQRGEVHYQTALWVWREMGKSPQVRPINNVKIYGGYKENLWAGRIVDGIERFWRNLFAGHASVRFHRPPSGIGINNIARGEIQRMRQVVNSVNFFEMEPCNQLLDERQENEVFCLATPDRSELLLYFTGQGQVGLNLSEGTYVITTFSGDDVLNSGQIVMPQKIYNNTIYPVVMKLERLDPE